MNQQQPHNSDSSPSTEADYLAEQAREAAAAIGSVFSAFKSDLANGVDPATLAKQHPWIAIGAATLAGFAAASTVIPSKDEQALKKLSRIELALHPEPFPSSHAPPQPAPEPQSIAGRIFAELLSSLRPALSSALAAYAATRTPHHDGNGHSAPPQNDPNPT